MGRKDSRVPCEREIKGQSTLALCPPYINNCQEDFDMYYIEEAEIDFDQWLLSHAG